MSYLSSWAERVGGGAAAWSRVCVGVLVAALGTVACAKVNGSDPLEDAGMAGTPDGGAGRVDLSSIGRS